MTSYGDIHKWQGYWKIASLRLAIFSGTPGNWGWAHFRSLGWTNPSRVRKCILQGYPWKKVEFWRNKTFFGPTFPFPWSPGLSSLAALGRQLSCRSRKVKSCPLESFVPPQFHSFMSNPVRIYILNLKIMSLHTSITLITVKVGKKFQNYWKNRQNYAMQPGFGSILVYAWNFLRFEKYAFRRDQSAVDF